MKRKASAVWQGDLKSGKGTLSTESAVLTSTPYSFSTRFENTPGTNPEELIAAAHAGCYAMALSAQLTEAGTPPQWIETTATVMLEKTADGFGITAIHLDVVARVEGIEDSAFQKSASKTKEACPISKLFRAPITLEARLET